MNGIMYSTQYPDDMGTNMAYGLLATNLYTGANVWTLNTTNALRCGMVTSYHNINQYGVSVHFSGQPALFHQQIQADTSPVGGVIVIHEHHRNTMEHVRCLNWHVRLKHRQRQHSDT